MQQVGEGSHGCLEAPEGAVWRVERKGKFDFMAKWVDPTKVDGKYLPELHSSEYIEPIWNWCPEPAFAVWPKVVWKGNEDGSG
jgi:hypothetical protein